VLQATLCKLQRSGELLCTLLPVAIKSAKPSHGILLESFEKCRISALHRACICILYMGKCHGKAVGIGWLPVRGSCRYKLLFIQLVGKTLRGWYRKCSHLSWALAATRCAIVYGPSEFSCNNCGCVLYAHEVERA
jgi:hypothetical protein